MFANRKKMRIEKEKNRKIRENDLRFDCLIETCVVKNVSNLIVLKTNEIVALKYDVMCVCMKSNLQLFLSTIFKKKNAFDVVINQKNSIFQRICNTNRSRSNRISMM